MAKLNKRELEIAMYVAMARVEYLTTQLARVNKPDLAIKGSEVLRDYIELNQYYRADDMASRGLDGSGKCYKEIVEGLK